MPTAPTQSSRRWMRGRLKLSVRGLMLFVAIVGGGIGWVAHRARTQRRVADAVVRCGGQVAYDQGIVHPHRVRVRASSPFWRLYGEYFETVTYVDFLRTMKQDRVVRLGALSTFTRLKVLKARGVELTDAELVAISKLGRLSGLDLEGTGIDDAGVARLAGLGGLRWLGLEGADITDAGLADLGRLSQLVDLDLSQTGVTDAGVIHLVKLPALRSLRLHATAVSSKGLRALGQIPSLRYLEIHADDVGDQELAALRRAFPSLQIDTIADWTDNCLPKAGAGATQHRAP